MPLKNIGVGSYLRKTKSGKVVRVEQYHQIRDLADLLKLPGRPQMQAKSGQYSGGRSIPMTPASVKAFTKEQEAKISLAKLKTKAHEARIKAAEAPAPPEAKISEIDRQIAALQQQRDALMAKPQAPQGEKLWHPSGSIHDVPEGGQVLQHRASKDSFLITDKTGTPTSFVNRAGKAMKPPAHAVKAKDTNYRPYEPDPVDQESIRLSHEVLDRARQVEPEITSTLQATAEAAGGHMEGLDYRLKTLPSLSRKIKDKSASKGLKQAEYASRIGDALRYTATFEPDTYVEGAQKVLAALEAQGHTPASIENSWGAGGFYYGVNMNIKAPNGMTWELQIHTPDSLRVKEQVHPHYEVLRDVNALPEKKDASAAFMREAWQGVRKPRGWQGLGDHIYDPSSEPDIVGQTGPEKGTPNAPEAAGSAAEGPPGAGPGPPDVGGRSAGASQGGQAGEGAEAAPVGTHAQPEHVTGLEGPYPTQAQRDAVFSYAGSAYYDLNTGLRDGSTLSAESAAIDAQLTQLLDAGHRTTKPLTLVRQASSGVVSDMQEGSDWVDAGWVSSSHDMALYGSSTAGLGLMEIDVPAGTPAIDLDYVAGWEGGEAEVILPKGSRFRVSSRETVDNGTPWPSENVHLELLPPAEAKPTQAYHVTRDAAALRTGGFDLSKSSGEGQVYGPGVYLAKDEHSASLYTRTGTERLSVTVPASAKLLKVGVKENDFPLAVARAVAEAAGVEKEFEAAFHQRGAEGPPLWQDLQKLLRAKGYDGLDLSTGSNTPSKTGVGGNQLVIFDPKNVTVEAASSPKAPAPAPQLKASPVTTAPGDRLYVHPQGKSIVVHPDGSQTVYSKDGKPGAKTSATPEKLAKGHGDWKDMTPAPAAKPAEGAIPKNPTLRGYSSLDRFGMFRTEWQQVSPSADLRKRLAPFFEASDLAQPLLEDFAAGTSPEVKAWLAERDRQKARGDVGTVRLYRGVPKNAGPDRVLTSWTPDKKEAENFAVSAVVPSEVISRDVPNYDIVAVVQHHDPHVAEAVVYTEGGKTTQESAPSSPPTAQEAFKDVKAATVGHETEEKSKEIPKGSKHAVPMVFSEAPVTDVPKFIADDNYFFQQKVDGVRGQLVVEPGKKPWFRSKSGGQLVSGTANKISEPLLAKMPAMSAEGIQYTVDGEMLNGHWYIFDMQIDGHNDTPWEERMAVAEAWVEQMNKAGLTQIRALPVARTREEKQALFEAVHASGGEGVMMKNKNAKYRFGQKVNDIVKAKFTSTADVIVMDKNVGGKDSAQIGVYKNGKLTPVGTVSLLGKEKQHGTVSIGDVIEVRYLYAHPESGNLTQITMLKKRPDKDPTKQTDEQFRFVNKDVLDLPSPTGPARSKMSADEVLDPKAGPKQVDVWNMTYEGVGLDGSKVKLTSRTTAVDHEPGTGLGWHAEFPQSSATAHLYANGEITDESGKQVGHYLRSLWQASDGTLIAGHSQLSLDPSVQHHGFASAFNRSAEAWYRAVGVSEIKLEAAGAGAYAWARAGYDWDPEAHRQYPEVLAEAFTAMLDRGRQWLAKNLPDDRELSAQFEAMLKRAQDHVGGDLEAEDMPTPNDIAMLGWAEGASDWVGKYAIMWSGWQGRKVLSNE